MITLLENAINRAFNDLLEEDGELFSFHINDELEPDGRKLHEVCINHKLAIHLSQRVIPLLQERGIRYFTDIEFNRNGQREKAVIIDQSKQIVRPDIIIHNRIDGDEKSNFLIVECKKEGCTKKAYNDDVTKIIGLMQSEDFMYEFGLMVVYQNNAVEAEYFWHHEGTIQKKKINC